METYILYTIGIPLTIQIIQKFFKWRFFDLNGSFTNNVRNNTVFLFFILSVRCIVSNLNCKNIFAININVHINLFVEKL